VEGTVPNFVHTTHPVTVPPLADGREIARRPVLIAGGGPVGLSTLAVAVSEEQDTIEDVYEPYLLQCGFLQRTPRGRVATAAAWSHLGLPAPTLL